MLMPMRKLLVPVFAVSLAAGGLAYAAEGRGRPQSPDRVPTVEVEAFNVDEIGELEAEQEVDPIVDPTGASAVTGTGWSTEGCPEGFTGNHGQFVSSTEDRPRRDAARSPCGKPLSSFHPDEEEEGDVEEVESADVDADDDADERGDRGLHRGHEKGRGQGGKRG